MSRPDDFLLITLVGPSGSGKSTLARRLLAEFPELMLSISYTTRPPRPQEIDGREYHFVTRERFIEMNTQCSFLEWAEVHGNLYGTGAQPIETARLTHRGIVFDVDYQGARQIRANIGEIVGIFVLPPSMEELERRLRGRATDTDEVIATRMRKAKEEIEQYSMFDYLVLNDSLDRAFDELRGIVMAERARRPRRSRLAETLLVGKSNPSSGRVTI